MYKKSRLKIIMLTVSALILLWIATLSIIYLTTYQKIATENRAMMELYAKEYEENGAPASDSLDKPGKGPGPINHNRLEVSSFYSVSFKDQEVEVTNDGPPLFTDEELVERAEEIKENQKEFGIVDNLVYLVKVEESYTLVVLMDNTLVGETMNSLVHYMLMFGGAAVVVLIVIAFALSGWIIRPLEENDKKQKQFISDAGHELKTPISTVNANLELLEREMGENKWLSNIRYENGRMETIVKQLLDLARIQNVKPEFSEVAFSRLVMAGVLPFEAQAFESAMTLECDTEDDIFIKGNPQQLQMLLSTLLDNAFTHSKPGGTIQVSLKKTGKKVRLVVSNEGDEIPKEDRARIFERFYKVEQSRQEHANHYGLGLAIAKNIVQLHHGEIGVECGDGRTWFVVELG